MKKFIFVFIIVIIAAVLALTSCMPSTPEGLIETAKTTWGNAYGRTTNDTVKIQNVAVTAPIKAQINKSESIATLITLEIFEGIIEMERKIIGNTYYMDFVLKNLKGKFNGKYSDVINSVIKIDNLSELQARLSGKLTRDKITLKSVIINADKISDGAPSRIENVIFDEKKFEPVVTSVIKMLMQQNLFGSIPPSGVIDTDNRTYTYSYDDGDKINSEFMRLPKLLVDAIKDVNFKSGWRTLAEILNNNFNTTDFVKIAKEYIKQTPVEVLCRYDKDKNGVYFNSVETEMSMSIPKLPKYFFGQILELVGVTGLEITDDCSAVINVGLKTDMKIDKAIAG